MLRAANVPPTQPEIRDALLRQSALAARQLLGGSAGWPRDYPDDNIWHTATEAEARLLCGEWDQAAGLYRQAMNAANAQPFHRTSIGNQLKRLLKALAECGAIPDDKRLILEQIAENQPRG